MPVAALGGGALLLLGLYAMTSQNSDKSEAKLRAVSK
jgi:hypothetical protein